MIGLEVAKLDTNQPFPRSRILLHNNNTNSTTYSRSGVSDARLLSFAIKKHFVLRRRLRALRIDPNHIHVDWMQLAARVSSSALKAEGFRPRQSLDFILA